MINVGKVLNNPRLATSFTVLRPLPASQVEGAYVPNPTAPVPLTLIGVVTPSTAADVTAYLPEGERAQRSVTVRSQDPLYMSDGLGRQADVVVWQGQTYRVQYAKLWESFGYYFVMATWFPGP